MQLYKNAFSEYILSFTHTLLVFGTVSNSNSPCCGHPDISAQTTDLSMEAGGEIWQESLSSTFIL